MARDLIAAAGHGEHFGHGLGHGVGLEVHEGPPPGRGPTSRGWSPATSSPWSPACTCPGRGGVRIEDLVVVTEDGCECFSSTTKELTVVA